MRHFEPPEGTGYDKQSHLWPSVDFQFPDEPAAQNADYNARLVECMARLIEVIRHDSRDPRLMVDCLSYASSAFLPGGESLTPEQIAARYSVTEKTVFSIVRELSLRLGLPRSRKSIGHEKCNQCRAKIGLPEIQTDDNGHDCNAIESPVDGSEQEEC